MTYEPRPSTEDVQAGSGILGLDGSFVRNIPSFVDFETTGDAGVNAGKFGLDAQAGATQGDFTRMRTFTPLGSGSLDVYEFSVIFSTVSGFDDDYIKTGMTLQQPGGRGAYWDLLNNEIRFDSTVVQSGISAGRRTHTEFTIQLDYVENETRYFVKGAAEAEYTHPDTINLNDDLEARLYIESNGGGERFVLHHIREVQYFDKS